MKNLNFWKDIRERLRQSVISMREAKSKCGLWLGLFLVCLAALPVLGEDLPPIDEVLRRMVKRAQSSPEDGKNYYLCTKQMVTEDMDSEGKVTHRKVRISEKRSNPGGAADANKWSNKNGFNLDEDLLSRFTFTLEKREVLNGRPTLVLQFVPRVPAAPIRQIQDRVLNLATGTVWVDEAEFELAKASIWLSQPVSFGILGAIDSFYFSFERIRAEQGDWLTKWTDTTVKARKFIRPFQTRKRVDWNDFKPMPPEAVSKLQNARNSG